MKNRVRILIVDDDETIRRTMSLILEGEGYTVETAETGRQAVEKSRAKIFNAALLDIRLPDMEGTKLLKKLRQTTPKTIKIMVTGYPQLSNAVEALNSGADAYLIKPVKPDELIKTLKHKLEAQNRAKKTTEENITAFLETRTHQLLQNLG